MGPEGITWSAAIANVQVNHGPNENVVDVPAAVHQVQSAPGTGNAGTSTSTSPGNSGTSATANSASTGTAAGVSSSPANSGTPHFTVSYYPALFHNPATSFIAQPVDSIEPSHPAVLEFSEETASPFSSHITSMDNAAPLTFPTDAPQSSLPLSYTSAFASLAAMTRQENELSADGQQ